MRVPRVEEIEARVRRALAAFCTDQFWPNPDCGLKTRRWDDVRATLANMVAAAQSVRDARSRERSAGPGRSVAGRKRFH